MKKASVSRRTGPRRHDGNAGLWPAIPEHLPGYPLTTAVLPAPHMSSLWPVASFGDGNAIRTATATKEKVRVQVSNEIITCLHSSTPRSI